MIDLENIIKTINNSKKTLYILCGLPYSGKTYISELLNSKTSCVNISIDEIFHAMGFDWNSNNLPSAEKWDEIFNISYQKTKDALKNNSNVLYDSTNHTKISRDRLRNIANEIGADTKVVYINTPIDTIWKRWEENITTKKRSIIDKSLMTSTISSFEPPTQDEDIIIIKQ